MRSCSILRRRHGQKREKPPQWAVFPEGLTAPGPRGGSQSAVERNQRKHQAHFRYRAAITSPASSSAPLAPKSTNAVPFVAAEAAAAS